MAAEVVMPRLGWSMESRLRRRRLGADGSPGRVVAPDVAAVVPAVRGRAAE